MTVAILMDSASGTTSITEDSYARIYQKCPGIMLEGPYNGSIEAVLATEQTVSVSRFMPPLH